MPHISLHFAERNSTPKSEVGLYNERNFLPTAESPRSPSGDQHWWNRQDAHSELPRIPPRMFYLDPVRCKGYWHKCSSTGIIIWKINSFPKSAIKRRKDIQPTLSLNHHPNCFIEASCQSIDQLFSTIAYLFNLPFEVQRILCENLGLIKICWLHTLLPFFIPTIKTSIIGYRTVIFLTFAKCQNVRNDGREAAYFGFFQVEPWVYV